MQNVMERAPGQELHHNTEVGWGDVGGLEGDDVGALAELGHDVQLIQKRLSVPGVKRLERRDIPSVQRAVHLAKAATPDALQWLTLVLLSALGALVLSSPTPHEALFGALFHPVAVEGQRVDRGRIGRDALLRRERVEVLLQQHVLAPERRDAVVVDVLLLARLVGVQGVGAIRRRVLRNEPSHIVHEPLQVLWRVIARLAKSGEHL
mmetsp:Transcript_39818/g.93439  ORF Transcript_39818/g.93439 Transcript_39818/m.93439 type:complete len:207 (-) Transcript_39818:70-690(-)